MDATSIQKGCISQGYESPRGGCTAWCVGRALEQKPLQDRLQSDGTQGVRWSRSIYRIGSKVMVRRACGICANNIHTHRNKSKKNVANHDSAKSLRQRSAGLYGTRDAHGTMDAGYMQYILYIWPMTHVIRLFGAIYDQACARSTTHPASHVAVVSASGCISLLSPCL